MEPRNPVQSAPNLIDCINGDLSLPGFTDKELKEMSEAEKDRVMRQY